MYKAEVTNNGGYRFDVKSGEYTFVIDAKGGGITPPDTLLASLASCAGVYARKYFDGAKIKVDEFKVTASAEFSKEAPLAFRTIVLAIETKGVQLDERRKAACLEFIKNCPVHNTLKAGPAVEMTISS